MKRFVIGIAFFVLIMTNLIMNVAAIAITLPVGIILGANIGSCITGLIAALRLSQTARQASFAQIMINVIGVSSMAASTNRVMQECMNVESPITATDACSPARAAPIAMSE